MDAQSCACKRHHPGFSDPDAKLPQVFPLDSPSLFPLSLLLAHPDIRKYPSNPVVVVDSATMVRPTSTSQNPVPGLPLPDGIVGHRAHRGKYRLLDTKAASQKPWDATVKIVKSCHAKDYADGRGLQTTWEFNKERKTEKSMLVCQGNHTGLTMQLKRHSMPKDENPELLMSIKLPNDLYRVSLRLFVSDRSIEVRKVHKAGSNEDDQCWALYFDDYEKCLNDAKIMLRRLANHCGEMPGDWFTYRNFQPQATGTPDRTPLAQSTNGPHYHEVQIAGGHVWKFTGFFASPEFRALLDGPPPLPTASIPAKDVEGMVTWGRAKLEGIVVDKIPLDPPMSAKRSQRIKRRYEARHPEPAKTKGKGKATALETPSESRAVEPPAQVKPGPSILDDDGFENYTPGLFEAAGQPNAGESSSSSAKLKKLGPKIGDDRSVYKGTTSRAPTEGKPEISEEPKAKAPARKRKAKASIQQQVSEPAAELPKVNVIGIEGTRENGGMEQFLVRWEGHDEPIWEDIQAVPPIAIGLYFQGLARTRAACEKTQGQTKERRQERRAPGWKK